MVAAAVLSLSNVRTQAVQQTPDLFIQVAEPADGSNDPWALTTYGWDDDPTITSSSEYFKISGVSENNLNGDIKGEHWFILTEPGTTTPSDVLRLFLGDDKVSLTFEMWSDGGDQGVFDTKVAAAKAANANSADETGGYQPVGGEQLLFNDSSHKLVINVLSDVEDTGVPPENIPTPDGGATMALLGGGISALALLRRKLS